LLPAALRTALQRLLSWPAGAWAAGGKAESRDADGMDPSVGDELTKLRWDRQAVPLTSFSK